MSLSFAWDKEQRQYKKKVIAFAQNELNNNLIERDKAGLFDREAWQKCADFGILGWPIPKEYGGTELDPLTTILALEGLGYGCRDNGLVFVINNHIWSCALSILNFGTEEQKQTFLPRMCNGEWIGGQVMTELESGSDAFSMQTTATRDGDEYVINGRKCFITNGPVGDIFIVFAKTDPNVSGARSISAFIVTKDAPGFQMVREIEKTGLRSAAMGELAFNECRIPVSQRLGEEGHGMSVFQSTIEWERGFFFATQVGTMERLLNKCTRYANQRQQYGQSIMGYQSVSNKLVDMKLRLEMAKLLVYKIGWLKKQGKTAFLEASMAKLSISEGLVETCRDAIQIHGARGYLVEYELERELRDALSGPIYAGTSEIQRNIIADFISMQAMARG